MFGKDVRLFSISLTFQSRCYWDARDQPVDERSTLGFISRCTQSRIWRIKYLSWFL